MNAMTNRYAISAYRTAQMTVPPLKAVVMLYDLALTRIAAAAAAGEARDYETQFNETKRASDVLLGLASILDMERGGAVAERLRDMYLSNSTALLRAVGRSSGPECCRRIGEGLRQARNAWAELAGMAQTEPLVSSPPAMV